LGTLTSVLSLTEGEEALRQFESGVRMAEGAKFKPFSLDDQIKT
jgi:hypothetical protein